MMTYEVTSKSLWTKVEINDKFILVQKLFQIQA